MNRYRRRRAESTRHESVRAQREGARLRDPLEFLPRGAVASLYSGETKPRTNYSPGDFRKRARRGLPRNAKKERGGIRFRVGCPTSPCDRFRALRTLRVVRAAGALRCSSSIFYFDVFLLLDAELFIALLLLGSVCERMRE